jgi:hypothetical protein
MMLMRAAGILTLLIIAGVYARTSWKLPGFRLLVIGVLAYVALLPIIMFSSVPLNTIPTWAQRSIVLPIGLVVALVARWVWKSARRAQQRAAAPPLAGAGVE